jgi:hypothetical protein
MFVKVKKEKRQQTDGCHLSPLLSAVQLNRVQRLSVAQEKTFLNSSRGGLGISTVSSGRYFERNSSNGGRQW